MIVIDASALIKYVLYEENWEAVATYIREKKPLYSIDHIIKEAGNAIWKHCYIRKIIKQDEALKLYNALLKPVDTGVIVLEPETRYILIALKIALKYGITLYDSLYLAQALKHGEILTSDRKQAEIASKLNIKAYLIK